MTRPTYNLRLFVAIYPPRDVTQNLLNELKTIDVPDNRLVPIEQIHLTLQFIGDVAAVDLDKVVESVQRSTGGIRGFRLQPQRLVTFPERGPARLVAVETNTPAPLQEIQRRLASRLARKARAHPGDRFRPHLTLCRFPLPAKGLRIDHAIDISEFVVEHIALMRSTLHPSGAMHHEMESIALNVDR